MWHPAREDIFFVGSMKSPRRVSILAPCVVCVCVCVCVCARARAFRHISYIQPLWLYHGIRYESQGEECSLETHKFGAAYDKR